MPKRPAVRKSSPSRQQQPSNQQTPPPHRPKRHSFRLTARNEAQEDYMETIRSNHLTFGLGPAGTGKTFLAVALAVEALREETVDRIILVRPAIEAGESLGFLPGSLEEKVDPYLRPIYDALHEIIGPEEAQALQKAGVIEVAPVAFMRGRTLKKAFVIVDEAQNLTVTQTKMILTRFGRGFKAVVNGDPRQLDLPKHTPSGFTDAVKRLENISGIGVFRFSEADVVRHPLVQQIVNAYEN